MTRVKICGMHCADDVAMCVAAGADALGFIFAESARQLTVDDAAQLTARVPPFVTTVGVFADSPAELIWEAIARCRLDVLQFSGDEAPEFCGSFGKPTIVVVGENARINSRYYSRARAVAVMVDSRTEEGRGGTGRTVDFAAARRLRDQCDRFFILAGGLRAENVAQAVRAIGPDAVDVRSGVERDGRKDAQLVRAFIQAAREA